MLDTINQEVIRKLRQRAKKGLKEHGHTMDRTDLSRLQWLVHAQSEALDFAVYLEKLIHMELAPTGRVFVCMKNGRANLTMGNILCTCSNKENAELIKTALNFRTKTANKTLAGIAHERGRK